MKIINSGNFQPITLQLETQLVLDVLMSLLCGTSFKFVDAEILSGEMVEILREYKYNPHLLFETV